MIEDYATEGRCVARHDGKVVFVERTVPGDVADVFLFKNKKDWAEGYPLQMHTLSERRITPFCSHFGDCGGCQWQSVPYNDQLQFKFRQVQDALQRIGKVPLPEFMPILGASEDRYYRNKLEYTFGAFRYISEAEFQQRKAEQAEPLVSPAGRGGAGFHAKGLFDKVVDITHCYLQPEPSNEIREAIRDVAEQHNLSYYDVRQQHGYLRNVQLRICTTGEVMVNIIVGEDHPDQTEALLQYLLQRIPSITTLLYTFNPKKNDSLHGLHPVTWYGKGYVIEKLSAGPGADEFSFKIGPKSFFQTNTKQAEKLYQVASDFAELNGTEHVYDLYCGTGSIGIFMSRRARKITGVDVIEEAIHDAAENAAMNQIASAQFFAGDVTDVCTNEFFATHGRPDVIITDPPRMGMHSKLLQQILQLEAPVLVYVSCNPVTQARDINLLAEKYRVTRVQPVDMFPHTHHIENVVQLKLKSN